MRAGPVFVVGASRSGTTLLWLMLNAHPRLALPRELAYFHRVHDLAGPPGKWGRALGPAVAAALAGHLAEICGPAPEGPPTVPGLYASALAGYAAREGAARWGDKTPGNLFYADEIAGLFPDGRFVHIVRDPRAVVGSAIRFRFLPDDPVVNAYNWRRSVRAARTAAVARTDRWLTVRFEALVADPVAEAHRVLAFLGEPFDPAVLAPHLGAEAALHGEVWTEQVTRPISRARADAWRDEVPDEVVAVVEDVCRAEMDALGYPPARRRRSMRTRATLAYCRYKTRRHPLGARHSDIGYEPLARVRALVGRRPGPRP